MAKYVGPIHIFDGSLRLPKYANENLDLPILSLDSSGNILIGDLKLNFIEDVSIIGDPSDGGVLQYDSSSSKWRSSESLDNLLDSKIANLKYEVTLDPPDPSTLIYHNLGEEYPVVTVVDLSTNKLVLVDVFYIDSSSLDVDLTQYDMTSSLKVVIRK